MNSRTDIFHPDFKAQPWWWEAWTPNNALSQDPPAKTDIVIVGAGYGGLSTALELRRNGVGAVVLERGDFGIGASTRNGGMISGGTNLGKGLGGKSPIAEEFERKKAELMGAAPTRSPCSRTSSPARGSSAGCTRTAASSAPGRRSTTTTMRDQGRDLQQVRQCRRSMVPRERQREFIASRLLLRRHACRRAPAISIPRSTTRACSRPRTAQGAILCANVEAERIEKTRDRLARADRQGTDRVPRSRGRDQRLYRRPDAPAEAPRRAGGEPHHRHRGAARARRRTLIPEHARDRRHQAGADLLPALARRQAA